MLSGVLLIFLFSIPLFSAVLPPLFDYPNHLARFSILATGGNVFYAAHWAPLPNLAGDLIVPLLAQALPLGLAGKLYIVMIFTLILGGSAWLNRLVGGGWRLWPLLSVGFLYNLQLLWGFLNYLFGLGAAICGAALWLALERSRIWVRLSASALVALLCFFSHVAALGLYALIVVGIELQPAFAEWRVQSWRALSRRGALVVAPFLIPTAIVLVSWRPVSDSRIVYDGFARKAEWLYGVFYNYLPLLDFISFFLFLGLLGGLAALGRLNIASRMTPAIVLVFVAYLLLPTEMLSAWAIDQRIVVGLFLLLVASAAPRFPNRRMALLIGAAALMIVLARLGIVEAFWLKADRVYAADLSGIETLPLGAKLAVAYPESALAANAIPEVHLPALATMRRGAFVPTVFAFTGQQPIALKPPYDRLAAAADPYDLWAAFMTGDDAARTRAASVLAEYDAIVFVDRQPFQVPNEHCLLPLFVRPTFRIFTLLHDEGCPAHR